jgi:hypothetical protein
VSVPTITIPTKPGHGGGPGTTGGTG